MKNKLKRPLRNDLLLIAGLLAAAGIGLIYLFCFRSTGNTVQVTVDGKLYGTYSLAEDRTEEIRSGADHGQLNRLVIANGKAYMESATCPDGICVDHAPIFRDGESIVCLPQRVVVTVKTKQSNEDPDIIV